MCAGVSMCACVFVGWSECVGAGERVWGGAGVLAGLACMVSQGCPHCLVAVLCVALW